MTMVLGICVVTAVKISMVPIQHYCTLRICNMHLESWWVAVGNKNVCVAPAIASHSGYQAPSKTQSSSSTSTLSIVA